VNVDLVSRLYDLHKKFVCWAYVSAEDH